MVPGLGDALTISILTQGEPGPTTSGEDVLVSATLSPEKIMERKKSHETIIEEIHAKNG